ncbi:hypothetical protein QTN24_15375 [Cupriavidus sp. SZY C1]|nr:hypothetical protein [Cupriavidus sp. SZY C1]MDT6962880.1 hypothetical protein [Cupriavidus sp. SZY C1]
MSFIFSRALVEASLQVNCSAVDAYAPLNLIPTPRPSLSLAKMTAPFLRSRFGMTFEPLTEDLGAELLTSWLEGFHARTSAQLEPEMDLTESAADSGQKWRASFAKYDPAESKWRTPQCSLLGDFPEFSETWPRWGSMRNGVSYLRPTSALPTFESESGLWPTPTRDSAVMRDRKYAQGGTPLTLAVKLWPTPTVHGNHNKPGASKNAGWGLSSAAKLWPTPTASLADKGGRITPRKGREGGTLIEAVSARAMWPTPCASASKGSSPAALVRKNGRDRSNDRIDHAVMASDGGQLNPEWVEWLMGWPIGHTALKPLETARYQEWLQQHGIFSGEGARTEPEGGNG